MNRKSSLVPSRGEDITNTKDDRLHWPICEATSLKELMVWHTWNVCQMGGFINLIGPWEMNNLKMQVKVAGD